MTEPILDPAVDYPLSLNRKDLLSTPNGKSIDDITMDAVMSGAVQASDLRITPQTLRLQAQIAEKVGRRQLGANLRRAAEMTAISDERVLQIYNALRLLGLLEVQQRGFGLPPRPSHLIVESGNRLG